MPMPTASPGWRRPGSNDSSVSSARMGSPKRAGVAAASTNIHRGVMTATPNEMSLGLTRNTFMQTQSRLTLSCPSERGQPPGEDGALVRCQPAVIHDLFDEQRRRVLEQAPHEMPHGTTPGD